METTRKTNFRLCAKRLFLTYPQCSLSKDEALSQFQKIFRANLESYCISQEHHSDGNLHLHAFIGCKDRVDWSSPTCLDLQGTDATVYHGSYKSVGAGAKNYQTVLQYLIKEDQSPLTNLAPTDFQASTPKDKNVSFAKAIAAGTKEEAEKILMEEAPRVWVTNYSNVQSFLESKRPKPKLLLKKRPPNSWMIPDLINTWTRQIGLDLDRCRLLIVISPPGIGKTSYFRSLDDNHAYISGQWALEPLTYDYKYVIIDDVDWKQMEQFKVSNRCIFLGKDECYATDKYKKKTKVVCQGRPCVILANDNQMDVLYTMFKLDDSFKDCTDFIELDKPLYKEILEDEPEFELIPPPSKKSKIYVIEDDY